jgi:MYXO-CTERM domain-containing protein
MTKLASRYTFAASLAAAACLVPMEAFAAGPEACGNIELTAIGECHFEFEGGCTAQCEPVRFVAACDGQCNASIDASCDAECRAECAADCQVNPGAFDCRASCTADCQANAEAQCGTDQDCRAYFEADCSATCEAECEVVPPSAECEAQCSACCSGSCEVDANFECSLDCQAEMQGGCELDCTQPEGALFCDGQYIAVADLPACLEYLATNFEVNAYAEGSAEASVTCAAAPGNDGESAILIAMAGIGIVAVRRRRRR